MTNMSTYLNCHSLSPSLVLRGESVVPSLRPADVRKDELGVRLGHGHGDAFPSAGGDGSVLTLPGPMDPRGGFAGVGQVQLDPVSLRGANVSFGEARIDRRRD